MTGMHNRLPASKLEVHAPYVGSLVFSEQALSDYIHSSWVMSRVNCWAWGTGTWTAVEPLRAVPGVLA